MSRNNEEKTSSKKDWMLLETDYQNGIKAQITYVTGDREGTIAYGQVVFQDLIAVKVGLVHSKGGHDFWSFPSKKGKDGEWYSDVIPQNKQIAGYLKDLAEDCVDWVLDEYPKQKDEERKSHRSRK